MSIKGLLDRTREAFVANDSLSPSRPVVYTRVSDDVVLPEQQSFIGAGQFNNEERETLENHQSFGGLKLDQKPQVNDIVLYDGISWKVKRIGKMGTLYVVYCEQRRHNGRPRK